MIKNYLLIAGRQMIKNKLYATINIFGLVLGLCVYLFSSLLATYERSHDTFFRNFERIFTAGSLISPTSNIGALEFDGIYTAFTPLILAEVEEVEAVARVVKAEFLVSIEDDHYYQNIRFTDPAFLKIFDFDYIEGDGRALDDPFGILITKSTATKFFGGSPALGRVLTLDHNVSLHVTAVVADLPPNTHFNSAVVAGNQFEVVAPLAALNRATGYNLAGNWTHSASGDFTYMLLPEDKTREWLQAKVDGIYERHIPERNRETVSGVRVRPLVEANTIIWASVGMPVLDSIRILGVLVLVIAIANYTNLATAQSMGRSREIGLRKTMGAARWQLIVQFMVESLCITTISMVIALAILDAVVPIYNMALGRALNIDYGATLPWLISTTVGVGLVAGAYPAYLITRVSPIDSLAGVKGIKGSRFRSTMLGLQFSISIFMLAFVLIVFFQNQKIESASNVYPKSQIVTLQRVGGEGIRARHGTLRNELLAIQDVQEVSFSSQLPYLLDSQTHPVGPIRGDRSSSFTLNRVFVDEHFLTTYEIPLLQGRDFSSEVANDTFRDGVLSANVIVNELAVSKLGFVSSSDAIGKVFYDFAGDPRAYTIIGVTPNQNFQGFHSKIIPMVFEMRPSALRYASIRVKGDATGESLTEIKSVWERVIPDYPLQSEFLEDTFGQIFNLYSAATVLLSGFASVALSLSLVGLFGLSAFMAENRTKEIGIRKVMGANVRQIVHLLIWQFSRPVMWALLVTMPLAFFASGSYLNFFIDRISMPAAVVAVAGIVAVATAWAVVAIQALRIARSDPIEALRYE